ncbi:MAG: 3-deoxy-8-phosphooctulonate synthase [Phycisphaerae bacterium]|nr:3-deoxy-8-phosphooctulonate synthase [Phycisphaerae bacterium]
MSLFNIGDVPVGFDEGLFVIAGPCVIESFDLCMEVAQTLLEVRKAAGVPMVFKGSFDKANRSSITSYRGPGMEKGLEILAKIRKETGLPVMTDVHLPEQAAPVADVVDCLQIPAFLCRQTDLLAACAKTGKPISVKKGQFVSPEEMTNVVGKVRASGNEKIMLTERGTFFGYNRLVNDFGGFPIMKGLGCPVIFDATHSTQQPGGLGGMSGGARPLTPVLARAAVAAGANGLFMEIHPDPDNAKCDAACMIPTAWINDLVSDCSAIFTVVNKP